MRIFKYLNSKKIIILSFTGLFLFVFLYIFSVKFFEKNAYDTVVKLSTNKAGSDNIINVVIDDTSIKEISPMPWKRSLYSQMFNYIEKSGAKAIVFDAILTGQNDINDDMAFLSDISKFQNLVAGVNFSKNLNLKNNKDDIEYFSNHFALNINDKMSNNYKEKTKYTSYQEMFPEYINNLYTIGAVNTTLENDGAVRSFEPFIYMEGKYYPSLPLAVYLKLNDYKYINLYDSYYEIYSKDGLLATFPLKQTKTAAVQAIKWLAPYDKNSWIAHKQIKASDVIKSEINMMNGQNPIIAPNEFKDKIVVIGATANALYDLKITPLTVNMPGSTIQATIIDNLFSHDSVQIVNHYVNILIMLVFIGFMLLLIFKLTPVLSTIGILFLSFLYFYTTLFAYSHGFAINVTTPYLFFILTSILSYSYKFSVEDYKKEKLKKAMTKYINTNVVDDIIKSTDEEVKLGGKKTEVTILMADIRGFTKFSENLDPNEVTMLLNEYFGLMIPIIEQYKGSVNKFIGDAILAVFNEPIKDKNHPQNAILCATKMLSALQTLRKKWKSEDKPDIGISIGINTGTVFIGNIGTPNHLEYTVIGDTVNVASRIESQNRQFNTQILISETTYEYAKDMLDVIKISSVPIRGREKHIDIYEIINILEANEIN
ncbi:MAG: adenylate/guanylate cyclase domain-containing protein [Candidatus Gastranaerophilales bacterium]|nr:adenylate/guanylate cyclase domain-containing protein [Candidatus Gastranaerophilales bacterium]